MLLRISKIVSVLALFMSMWRCAQMTPLTGGQRDTTPPKLLEAFPKNNSTHFMGKELIFTFDEFVQVRDLTNQLMVSPTLKNLPTVRAEGKKIVVDFGDELLLPNTTYHLSFGKAICDMNESNPIENFEFVFSNGDHIDSLKISGSITEAFNNEASGSVKVALYLPNANRDSIPYIYVPNYATKTQQDGKFIFQNLPKADFELFAFTDANKNDYYDGEKEKIAFLGNTLKLNRDTTVELVLFQEEASKTYLKQSKSPYYGLAQLFLNKKTITQLSTLPNEISSLVYEAKSNTEKDTIIIFYRELKDSLDLILKFADSKKPDTLHLLIPDEKKYRNKTLTLNLNTRANILALHQKLQINFSKWMDTTKTSYKNIKLTQKQDTVLIPTNAAGKWTSVNVFELEVPLKEGSNYSLNIDKGTFFDFLGNTNDSSKIDFKTQNKLDFGKLTLNVTLNKKQSYLIQLINEQSHIIRESHISLSLSGSNTVKLDFTELPPGTYQTKIIFDDNKNRKWDTGNLVLRKQPERVLINSKQLKIVADWEIEEEIIEKD